MVKKGLFFLGVFVVSCVVVFGGSLSAEADSKPDLGRFDIVFEENQGVYVAEDSITGLLYYVTYNRVDACIDSICPYNIVDENGQVRQAISGVDYE